MAKFYRVCNTNTQQGLWYNFQGEFTGLIHDKFKFCLNNELKMEYDPEIVGWLSATDSLETLYKWFTREDIKELQKRNWYIHVYEAEDVRFYERFQHQIIKQETSKFIEILRL